MRNKQRAWRKTRYALLLAALLPWLVSCTLYAPKTEPSAPVVTPEPVIATPAPTKEPAVVTPEPTAEPDPLPGLIVNEASTGTDFDVFFGLQSAWAELYNTTDKAVTLDGLALSDREDKPKKALTGTLGAGDYLLIPLGEGSNGNGGSSDGSGDSDGSLFSLKAGETVYLIYNDGRIVSSLLIPEDAQGWAVTPEGFERFPTPGFENGKTYPGAVPAYEEDGLFISEVMATGEDEWIELKNGGAEAVSLTGCRLGTKKEPGKWPLSGTVDAGGFYVLENVTLPAAGETLYLFSADGRILDCYASGAQAAGVSSGRLNGERVFFTAPTKGQENAGETFKGYAPAVSFSETGLYHEKAFKLKLSAGQAVIRYTLDGSPVTESSPVYTEPLAITESCAVRARAYEEGRLEGEERILTYLFTEAHTVPVVCLTLPASDFKKVYSAEERNEVTERAAYFTFYGADGREGVSFPCGVKAKGRGSLVFAQKSLTIKLRSKYGQKSAILPFFGLDAPSTSFCLRAGGQDIKNAIFRDTLIQRASENTAVDAVITQPAVLYVNGSYYGLFMLQEEMDAGYFVTHYGLEKDNLDVINQNAGVRSGTLDGYTALRKLAQRTGSDDADFEKLAESIDVEAFTDYAVIQTLTGNSDVLNQKVVSARDGSFKWRPMLFDEDSAFGAPKTDLMNAYFKSSGFTPSSQDKVLCNNDVFKALYRNKAWREKFAKRMVELLATDFSEENLNRLIDELVKEMEPEMGRQIQKYHFHKSVTAWKEAVQRLRNVIAARKSIVYKQLKSYFSVTDAQLREWEKEYKK